MLGGGAGIRTLETDLEIILAVRIRPWVVHYPERVPKKFFNLVIPSGEISMNFIPHR